MGLAPGPDPGVYCMHCHTGACTALVRTCMVVVCPPRVMLSFYVRMCVWDCPLEHHTLYIHSDHAYVYKHEDYAPRCFH